MYPMITGRQIRAARSLLDWSAEVLAEKTGLTRVTISKIENSSVQPHENSLGKIFRALSENGIEFIGTVGVRLKSYHVEVLEGGAGFNAFYDFLYDHLNENGGTAYASGMDETLFAKYRLNGEPDAIMHRKRMGELVKRRNDVHVKILVKEGVFNFTGPAYTEYRWQPAKNYSDATFYVYGDTLALISFAHEPTPLIIMIKSAGFADAYRRLFDVAWANAMIVPAKRPGHA
ncbi:MAG: helix-turn-helix domain-containing protein [Azospirillum sp.]|nr:helix-turn-helix domain-containing protein [Azospirillum sp.]